LLLRITFALSQSVYYVDLAGGSSHQRVMSWCDNVLYSEK